MDKRWAVEVFVRGKFTETAFDFAVEELNLTRLSSIHSVNPPITLWILVILTNHSSDESITLYSGGLRHSSTPYLSYLINRCETFRQTCSRMDVRAELHIGNSRSRGQGLVNAARRLGAVKLFVESKRHVFQRRKSRTVEYCISNLPPGCSIVRVYSAKKCDRSLGRAESILHESSSLFDSSRHCLSTYTYNSAVDSLETLTQTSCCINSRTHNDATDSSASQSSPFDEPNIQRDIAVDCMPNSKPVPARASESTSLLVSPLTPEITSEINSELNTGDAIGHRGEPGGGAGSGSSTELDVFVVHQRGSDSIGQPNSDAEPELHRIAEPRPRGNAIHGNELSSSSVRNGVEDVVVPLPTPESRLGTTKVEEINLESIHLESLDSRILLAELKRLQEEAREAEEKAKKAMGETALLQSQTNGVRKEAADALASAMIKSQREAEEREILKRWQVDFRKFSFANLAECCNFFEQENCIGEGNSGTMYKGVIDHTNVAVKLFSNHELSLREFSKQVSMQASVRHPNMVLTMGYCDDPPSMVYEYMSNGNLLQRIKSSQTNPLPWHTRFGILVDVCKALVHLHNREPPIFGVNLMPSNILLDSNHVAKLGDVTTQCHSLRMQMETWNSSECCLQCILPSSSEHSSSRPINSNPLFDIYSLGVLMWHLLIGDDDKSFTAAMSGLSDYSGSNAESGEKMRSFWDASAGPWPEHVALELATLAKECMHKDMNRQPPLTGEIMPALMRMKDDVKKAMDESKKQERVNIGSNTIPHSFLCPITWELMEEPVIASDGHTYERIAIVEWLKKHNTSPKTGLILPNTHVMPNHVLHSMIEDWKDDNRQFVT